MRLILDSRHDCGHEWISQLYSLETISLLLEDDYMYGSFESYNSEGDGDRFERQ
jgi:hypothetical protein